MKVADIEKLIELVIVGLVVLLIYMPFALVTKVWRALTDDSGN
jgi:hypothetical protein